MDLRAELFAILGELCASNESAPLAVFHACPVNHKNCAICLLDDLFAHRIKQTDSRFLDIFTCSKLLDDSFLLFAEEDFASSKSQYIFRILTLVRMISLLTVRQGALSCEEETNVSFNGSEKRTFSFAFDAFFYVTVYPLLPPGIAPSLDKTLPLDSILRFSPNYSHSNNSSQGVRLLDNLFSIFVDSLVSRQELFTEFAAARSNLHFEGMVGALVFLSRAPLSKEVLGEERCLFWLKKLEDDILSKVPLPFISRIILTNLNRCSNNANTREELMYAAAVYGHLLSKTLLLKNGVRNFIEVFMETSAGSNSTFDQLSQEELWKRGLAVAAVLIRSPSFLKASDYYESIADQLIQVLDASVVNIRASNKFVPFVFGAILLQSHLAEKKNTALAAKLSKVLRSYFFPSLVKSFLNLDVNLSASFDATGRTSVDLICLVRISEIVNSIPEAVWSHLDVGDIHNFLRAFLPYLMEVYSSLPTEELLPHCKSIFARFLVFFPLSPNSQSVDILSDWLLRPMFLDKFEFQSVLISSAEKGKYEFDIKKREEASLEEASFFETRLACIRSLASSLLDRSHYLCTVWSLFISCMRRLLLYLNTQNQDSSAVFRLYSVLGSLSEEVGECSEIELADIILASTSTESDSRLNVLLEFIELLCDRLIVLSSSEDDTFDAKSLTLFESSISVSLTIVSSVLMGRPDDNNAVVAFNRLKPKLQSLSNCKSLSSQSQEMLKAIASMLQEDNISVTPSSSLGEDVQNLNCNHALKIALTDISNPMCAIKGHGLIMARRVFDSTKSESIDDRLLSYLFRVLFECLSHEDSYVHLNAAATMTSLGLCFHKQILSALAALYASRPCVLLEDRCALNADVRLRIGECLCRIIRGLGDLAPVYRPLLLDSCLVAAKASLDQASPEGEDEADAQVKMRSSALSTLGQLAGALRFALASDSGEVLTCMAGYLTSRSEHVEVRRAAACSLVLLLRGFSERSHIFALADVLRDVGRILRACRVSCLDEVLMLHVDMGLSEIDRLGRLLLQPENELRSLIKPVTEMNE